jgi:hypothetical protein
VLTFCNTAGIDRRVAELSIAATVACSGGIGRRLAVVDRWVKLRDRPHPFSDDEALLLCEADAGQWLAWVSGFGQITLQLGEFYRSATEGDF